MSALYARRASETNRGGACTGWARRPRCVNVRAVATRTLLKQSKVGRLGTLTAEGTPHLVPVCYALLEDDTLVIAIDEKPKRPGRLARLRHIDGNPRVSLLVDVYDDDDWTRLAWVRADGEAEIVEVGGGRDDALHELRERYIQYRSMALEERPLIVIRPRRVTAWRDATP